jgi:hypothetical protein
MADRPILFSAPMVQALIAGRKTQTRRVLKHPMAGNDVRFLNPVLVEGKWCLAGETDKHLPFVWNEPPFLPYAPGDRLWVREAWRTWISADELPPRHLIPHDGRPLWYEADPFELRTGLDVGRYRHARFMPRWASRLTLTVTHVRVQRLQDISAADSIAEGVECPTCEAMNVSACNRRGCFASIEAYRNLWNSLYGPDAWSENPWVAAISFTVQRGNIDALDLANGRAEE